MNLRSRATDCVRRSKFIYIWTRIGVAQVLYVDADTFPPRPVQLMSVGSRISISSNAENRIRTNILASLEPVVLLAGHDPKGVSTKVVALGLQEIRRDDLASVPVEKGECGAECRRRDTPQAGLRKDTSPASLGIVDGCEGQKGSACSGPPVVQETAPLLKKLSNRSDSRFLLASYACVMSPKNTLYSWESRRQ